MAEVLSHFCQQGVVVEQIHNFCLQTLQLILALDDTSAPLLQVLGIRELMLVGGMGIGHKDRRRQAVNQFRDGPRSGAADDKVGAGEQFVHGGMESAGPDLNVMATGRLQDLLLGHGLLARTTYQVEPDSIFCELAVVVFNPLIEGQSSLAATDDGDHFGVHGDTQPIADNLFLDMLDFSPEGHACPTNLAWPGALDGYSLGQVDPVCHVCKVAYGLAHPSVCLVQDYRNSQNPCRKHPAETQIATKSDKGRRALTPQHADTLNKADDTVEEKRKQL